MSLRIALTALAGAACLLAGCGSDPKPGTCPRAGILSDASTIVRFGAGPGRAPADVRYQGEITNIALACDPDDEEIDAELTLTMRVALGPSVTASRETLRYFVAVMQGSDQILAKEEFPIEVAFKEGERAKSVTDTLSGVRIPLAPGMSGGAYEVIVGFALTPDEVAFNRARRGS